MNLHQHSIDVIHAGQAHTGAYVASPNFSQYGYSWLRDGTWIAYAMQQAGESASAEAFYRWAAQTILRYEAHIERLLLKLAAAETPAEQDYLPTRFTLEGGIGKDDWTDFQLDGYGTWLWGLAQFCQTAQHPLWAELRPSVALTVRYLAALWQSSNYDCWEEHRHQVHTATLAALYGGLCAVQRLDPALVEAALPAQIRAFVLAECVAADGHFMKYIGNPEVDASLLWVAVPYGLVDLHDERFTKTLAKIERDLHRPQGGVYRYAADVYYGGGEWLLLTAWLGWAYVQLGRIPEAQALSMWVAEQAAANGDMPEQVNGHTLYSEHYTPWVTRWGEVASPLLWSHAMYLILEAALKAKSV